MKKLMMIWGFVTSMLFAPQLNAQVSVSININSQPDWGPVGYDYVEYYYLPDIDIYYSVIYNKYIYWDGYNWVWVRVLPARYTYYNFYTGYKVVINEPRPYYHHHTHVVKYKGYRNYHDHQNIIRDIKGDRPKTWKNSGYSKLKGQAPQQKSAPQKNSPLKQQAPAKTNQPQKGSPLKKQAPAKTTQPQKNSPLKNQAPQQKAPQQGSPLKKQAPTQQPQKNSPLKNQAPQQRAPQQQGLPLKKQAPAQQPSQPQRTSPLKNQAPQQSAPQRSPQRTSPMKNQAPTRQPAKSSPMQKAKGGRGG